MAVIKISDMTAAASVDFASDFVVIVDVSDNTQAASGTTKRVTIDKLQPTSFDASAVSSGTLALARGGTGADLSAAGGASHFVTQDEAGGAFASRVIAAADLPTTGLNIDAYTTSWGTATDGATVTFNIATHAKWKVTLGGNRTLAVSNAGTASTFTIKLVQDGTGSRTVTWWSGIKWSGGAAPTLTTTAGKADYFTFLTDGSGSYAGFTAGQNY